MRYDIPNRRPNPRSFAPTERQLTRVFEWLLARYGPQHWWPGETPFEVMVGAVLTQNTAWQNVERAIGNLKHAGRLDPQAIVALAPAELAEHLRPSGYFNVKAKRLQSLCRALLSLGGERACRRLPTDELRHALLAIHGVGPETADDILLYTFQRPVFVIDAYTRRLMQRLGYAHGEESYEILRRGFEQALAPDVALFNEYHALIVRHAKAHCRVKAVCLACPLAAHCRFRRQLAGLVN